jgi:hypothetical protein
MPELLFEIWMDYEGRSSSMSRVHPDNDKFRLMSQPNAVLAHSFTATSHFDAFRQNNAWHGPEPWAPDGREDQFFTEEEAAEQRAYLLERKLD